MHGSENETVKTTQCYPIQYRIRWNWLPLSSVL